MGRDVVAGERRNTAAARLFRRSEHLTVEVSNMSSNRGSKLVDFGDSSARERGAA